MVKAAVAFAIVLAISSAFASEALRVGVAGEPPFVKWTDPGPPLGAAVEIWEKIATANSWTFSYRKFPSVSDGLAAVAAGEIDVLVGNTGITRARLAQVEFSQPFFRSGLQIMIPEARPHSVSRIWSDLAGLTRLEAFWYVVGAVVLLTIAVFLFERRHNPDFPKTRREGIAESFYYVVSLALTGKSVYKGFPGVLGRLVMVVWTILGLLTVAYVTSSITSAMTVEKLTSRVSGPQDLPGKTVAAIAGTTGADYLRENGVTTLPVDSLEEAVSSMLGGKAAAIVDDAPVLQMFDFGHPQLPITEVGPIFSPENYGFALAIGSPLRLPVNAALLELIESQDLSDILQRYMGDFQRH
ncbi:MAG: transporter substrate-binding domain-containing protein [Terrimicrobiaceae bacterium]